MAKYKNIVPDNTKVVIKKLSIELRGGMWYQEKVLKKVHDEGFTAFVEKVTPPKKKEEKDGQDKDDK